MPSWKLTALAFGALLVSAEAEAEAESRIAIAGGYGSELDRARRPAPTAYGLAIGARLEQVFDHGIYLGADLTFHRGSDERAFDRAGVSSYRSAEHVSYIGPELGWEIALRSFLLRPYVGGGAWALIDRISVRNRESRDDVVNAFVMPGIVFAYRARNWYAGLDARLPIVLTLPLDHAAPSGLVTVGFPL